jgi:hypothetical protein
MRATRHDTTHSILLSQYITVHSHPEPSPNSPATNREGSACGALDTQRSSTTTNPHAHPHPWTDARSSSDACSTSRSSHQQQDHPLSCLDGPFSSLQSPILLSQIPPLQPPLLSCCCICHCRVLSVPPSKHPRPPIFLVPLLHSYET